MSLYKESKEASVTFLNNYFTRNFPSKFEKKRARYQPGIISRISKEYTHIETNLSTDDKDALLEFFNKLSISRKEVFEKQELIKTKQSIEKKFLEDIVKSFERNLGRKSINEGRWQDFFKDNLWIFSQLFSFPAVVYKDKAYVGGKTISDQEGKIVDFLCTNKMTKNTALIEIKKHTSQLFSKKPYRGNDVFTLSKELSGAINQVLNQRETFTKKFESISFGEDNSCLQS